MTLGLKIAQCEREIEELVLKLFREAEGEQMHMEAVSIGLEHCNTIGPAHGMEPGIEVEFIFRRKSYIKDDGRP